MKLQEISRDVFAPFGDLIETDGAQSFAINNGTTRRFHALAQAEIGEGDAIISIFRGQHFDLPLEIKMMERHPLGSQAFMPLSGRPWIAVVAPDEGNKPGQPIAFAMNGNQGVQYAAGTWHHPLIALEAESDFLVVDRSGPGDNLEEWFFEQSLQLTF